MSQVDYGPKNETTYCEKLKTNLYRQKPRPSVHYHPQVRHHERPHVTIITIVLTVLVVAGGGDQLVRRLLQPGGQPRPPAGAPALPGPGVSVQPMIAGHRTSGHSFLGPLHI